MHRVLSTKQARPKSAEAAAAAELEAAAAALSATAAAAAEREATSVLGSELVAAAAVAVEAAAAAAATAALAAAATAALLAITIPSAPPAASAIPAAFFLTSASSPSIEASAAVKTGIAGCSLAAADTPARSIPVKYRSWLRNIKVPRAANFGRSARVGFEGVKTAAREQRMTPARASRQKA